MGDTYGITPKGFVPKRLDETIEEMHASASEGYGFNTRQNPESFLGVTITNIADKIAELWEVLQEVHLAHYPSSATGQSLDDVGQLGGSVRAAKAKTQYIMLCSGKEGTQIKTGNTRLSSRIEPKVYLHPAGVATVSTAHCNACTLALSFSSFGKAEDYTLSINGCVFCCPSETNETLISALVTAINAQDSIAMTATADSATSMTITADDELDTFAVIASSGFNILSVSSLVTFVTEDYGNIQLPQGLITEIATGPYGLESVCDIGTPVGGRAEETDEEFRISYARKIFIRSRTMLDSITAAIWANVAGVKSCAAYQNDTNVWMDNRPPHSVEVVVDVGSAQYAEVAKQILATKAAGIQTCHCCGLDAKAPVVGADADLTIDAEHSTVLVNGVRQDVTVLPRQSSDVCNMTDTTRYTPNAVEVGVIDEQYGNTVVVRFTKPIRIVCNFAVVITPSGDSIAPNTFSLIQEIVRNAMDALAPGDAVIPQKWLAELYKVVPGIDKFEINFTVENPPDGNNTARDIWTNGDYKFLPVCGGVTVATE